MEAPPVAADLGGPASDFIALTLDLKGRGIKIGAVHHNIAPAVLTEMAILRGEGELTAKGALNASTGARTGRSPEDRFVVSEPGIKDEIWWGPVNRPMEPATFQRLVDKAVAHLHGRELFIHDGWACADPNHRLSLRVITEKAWHALFAHCMFLRPPLDEPNFQPQFTILDLGSLRGDPVADSLHTDVFVALSFERRLVLIGGTQYAGEIKKSVFSVLNYVLPRKGVFSMHCSANIGAAGDTALFFGLSGTGKTTLSADPERRLIGDDEHGWSDDGVFNIEGGCYAKTIRLSRESEPQIWDAIRFGCVLENVVVDPRTRRPDFDDDRLTENTRAAYPVDFIDNCEPTGRGGHPANIVFLTCDAYGVLPPLARLSPDQANYHFLSGYTAKVAGTETGVTEPKPAFSTCFAAPFLPLHPSRYAEMLNAKVRRHGSQTWLVNTGWTGGPVGTGSRMKLAHTRSLLRAALRGGLAQVPCQPDPIFGLMVPQSCPGVPGEILQPRSTWSDPLEYDKQARHLAGLFQTNFAKYADRAPEAVKQAGPRVV